MLITEHTNYKKLLGDEGNKDNVHLWQIFNKNYFFKSLGILLGIKF